MISILGEEDAIQRRTLQRKLPGPGARAAGLVEREQIAGQTAGHAKGPAQMEFH